MTIKELREHIKNIPDDYEVKTGSYYVKEGEEHVQYFAAHNEKFIPVNDESILGIAVRDDKKEIRIIGVQKQVRHFGSGDFSKDTVE